MFPVLFSLGPISISTYGLLAVVAFFLGAFVVWKRGREEHFEEEYLFDVTLVATLWALVLGRVWYVVAHWSVFGWEPLRWLTLVRNPGITAEGALIGGLLAVVLVARSRKWSVWAILDVMVLGAMFAQIWLLLGAFLNGSGYGVRTGLPWAVSFPGVEGARHPTQLYWLLFSSVWFYLLVKIFLQYRTYEWYKGKVGVAASGLVANFYFFGLGWLFVMMAWLQPIEVSWLGIDARLWLGGFAMLVGVGLGYWRSGRELKEDWNNVGREIGQKLVKTKTEVPDKHEVVGEAEKSDPLRRRRRKRHGVVAGIDVK